MSSSSATLSAPLEGQNTREIPLDKLFEMYKLSEAQMRIFRKMKKLRNMPSSFADVPDEDIVWAVLVGSHELSSNPTSSDIQFCEGKIEDRLRRLDEGEKQYGWFTLKWTKPLMRRLLQQWLCGMLVIDPELVTADGSPLQFVHEYYGDASGYPSPENQTEEWKQESRDLYVLMARSTCLSYPMATTMGIVSFSDMADFDWNKYDMGTKERHANIGSYIPNRLRRMITFNPDEKMKKFHDDMGARSRKKWGFAQYEDFNTAVERERDLLPPVDSLPAFVGGKRRVDICKCLKHLFRREPNALELMLDTYSEMTDAGEIPCPSHMQ